MRPWTAVPDQTGRRIVITGANSGIGLQAARILASRGAEIVMACRNLAKAEEAAREIPGQAADRVTILELDVSSLRSVRTFAEALTTEFGEIDVLINNAGVLGAPYGLTEDGVFYYVMEFLPGLNLQEVVDRTGPLPPGRVVHLLRQVCSALGEAHRHGMIHRDIKPGNILLSEEGRATVVDFGIAQSAVSEKLTATGQVVGSPHYISPEQATGLGARRESDVYALGLVLYELLTGRTPLDPEELLRSGMNEMRRRIRETEPPRPSTRLSTMHAADLTTIANARLLEEAHSNGTLRPLAFPSSPQVSHSTVAEVGGGIRMREVSELGPLGVAELTLVRRNLHIRRRRPIAGENPVTQEAGRGGVHRCARARP